MTQMRLPSLSVDSDAAFDAVIHDQLGGPYQVPAELVRFAFACGATKVDVSCRKNRVVVEADGAIVPESALVAVSRASSRGDDIKRLQALATVEELDASALGWAAGLDPRSLIFRTWNQGQERTVSSSDRGSLQLSGSVSRRPDGLRFELHRPNLNFKQARRWLEIACRFSPYPVFVNGNNVQNDLDSGCFRARINSPLPAVIAMGVALEAPRLWLLRHGVVATRIGVPNWPPFEAAVEMEGRVEGRASAADLRQAIAPFLETLIGRVTDLTLKVVPRLSELSLINRQRIARSLIKAAEKNIATESIHRAPLFELVDHGGSRWISLQTLRRWPAAPPAVLDHEPAEGVTEKPYIFLGAREREMVARMIGRTLVSAAITQSNPWNTMGSAFRAFINIIYRMMGPRRVPLKDLTAAERELISSIEGALEDQGLPIIVTLTSGQRPPRTIGRRLVLARDHEHTRDAVISVAKNPTMVFPVAVSFKDARWTVTPEVRTAWRATENPV